MLLLQYKKHLILGATILLLAIVGTIAVKNYTNVNAAQQGTTIILLSPQNAYPGSLVTMNLIVDNAQNLAGYQATVWYDTDNLHLTGVDHQNGLSLSGRDMLLLEMIELENGVFFGAVTCPAANCGKARNPAASRYTQGVSGNIELATLSFIPQAPGRYEIILDNVHLVDPQANQLGATVTNTVLEVQE